MCSSVPQSSAQVPGAAFHTGEKTDNRWVCDIPGAERAVRETVEEAPGEVGRGCRLMWEGRGSALMSSCVSRGLRKPGSGPCGEEHSRHREQQVSEALRQEAGMAGAE